MDQNEYSPLDRSNLVEVPVAGGPEKLLTTRNWPMVDNPVWLADYSGIVFAASEPGSNNQQLWFLPYPLGEPHRITNDPNSYENLSLSPESKTFAATQDETFSNLWVAPEGKAELSYDVCFRPGLTPRSGCRNPTGLENSSTK